MDKKTEVVKYLQTVEQATLSEIYNKMPFGYYHNWSKYMGEILSRLVTSGKVERIKPGLFKFLRKNAAPLVDANQSSLF